MGFGLLFLFGLILEIAGMKRTRPNEPMPLIIALGKMIFLILSLFWTLIANIWTFSSGKFSNRNFSFFPVLFPSLYTCIPLPLLSLFREVRAPQSYQEISILVHQ